MSDQVIFERIVVARDVMRRRLGDAVLLTIDLDFANILQYPPQDYGDIVVMRYQAQDEEGIDLALKVALDDLYRKGLRGKLAVVSVGRYRVRG